jgi:hypothetical protein
VARIEAKVEKAPEGTLNATPCLTDGVKQHEVDALKKSADIMCCERTAFHFLTVKTAE